MIKNLVLILSCFLWIANQISSLDKGSSVINQSIQIQQIAANPQTLIYPSRQYSSTFQDFKINQIKSYNSPSQQQFRRLIYQQNLKKITNHNDQTQKASASNAGRSSIGYTMALNKFADLTQAQFRQIYTNTYPSSKPISRKSSLILDKQKNIQCNCKSSEFIPAFRNDSSTSQQKSLDDSINQILRYSESLKVQTTNSNSKQADIIPPFYNVNIQNGTLKRLLQNQQVFDIDWTKHAGKVRFQGLCGSCYAFAAADALSSMNSVFKFGFFAPLSPQQIVDCSSNGLTFGCNGGFIEGSYAYIQSKGITTQFAYSYKAKKQQCRTQKGSFKISSFKPLTSGSCSQLISELKKKPIAIGIAGYRLQFYSTGVFDDCNSYIDHAVLLIGYKSNVGWKIKNSWGSDWGMQGFAWIKDGNNCGICQNAVSATIPQETISS